MSTKQPMVRLNSHVEKHVFDSLQTTATEEGIAFAEVVRQVIHAGMLARQDQKTHQTRLFRLIEGLEATAKNHEQRLDALEQKARPPSS